MGEFFSIACAAVWALAVVLFRRSGETLPAFELNLFKNLLGVVLMGITVLAVENDAPPAFSVREWLIVCASGIIGIAVADTWYLRALNLMGAARTGVVASLFSPFVVLLSAMYLGELLRGWQLAGFSLVLAGILLVTWRSNRLDVSRRALRLGVFYGAGAVLMMAIGIVMVKPVLEGDHFFATAGLRLAAGTLAMLAFVSATRGWSAMLARYRQPQPWPTITLASVLASYLSMLLWLGGYRLAPASVASVLNETAAAFIVLFAWWVLKEPMSLRRVGGVCLTFAGVSVIVAM
ncbi:MAG TPA: DMT family transporter [Wenzhouxiangellaceae bacterium]|nr:DMT family transporter [Wenzhouxiangellaceae bacterium]